MEPILIKEELCYSYRTVEGSLSTFMNHLYLRTGRDCYLSVSSSKGIVVRDEEKGVCCLEIPNDGMISVTVHKEAPELSANLVMFASMVTANFSLMEVLPKEWESLLCMDKSQLTRLINQCKG